MIYIVSYLVISFLFLLLLAYLDRNTLREAVLLVVCFPLLIPLILFEIVLNLFGYQYNVLKSTGGWAIRRPDDGWPGIGLKCPFFEVLFWKTRPK